MYIINNFIKNCFKILNTIFNTSFRIALHILTKTLLNNLTNSAGFAANNVLLLTIIATKTMGNINDNHENDCSYRY